MVPAIFEVVFKITGKRPKTLDQVKAELIAFLHINQAGDLIVDDDLLTLMELASVFAHQETLIDDKMISIIRRSDPMLYQRAGAILIPYDNQDDQDIIQSIGKRISDVHPDLHFSLRKDGLIMMDARGTVVSYTHIRPIIGIDDEYSGRITLPRIKMKDEFNHLISEPFFSDKKWGFKGTGASSRCEGRYFTVEELLELLMDRKIITYGSYI